LAGSVGGCAESREITWPPPTKISTWVEAKTGGHLIKFGFKVKLINFVAFFYLYKGKRTQQQ